MMTVGNGQAVVHGPHDETLISPEMQAAVGREFKWFTSFPVSASDIRRWAIAVYYPDPPPRLYWDEDYAKGTRWGGIVAPEEFNPFAGMRAEPPGDMGLEAKRPWPEVHLGIEPPKVRASVVMGLDVEYTGVRVRPGDVIKSTLSLGGYSEKMGSRGLMLITIRVERWVNQCGELIRTYRSHLGRYR